MKHTQWIFQRSMVAAKSNFDILEKGGFEILASLGHKTETANRDEANARLIAAAPDLLTVCQRQLDFIELYCDRRHINEAGCAHCLLIEDAKQAIAKATP